MAKFDFYKTQRWQKLRQRVIDNAGGICEICIKGKGNIAHHKIWVTAKNINDPKIVWSIDNLQCVCESCHYKIHFGEVKSVCDGLMFDDDGNLIEIL